MGIAVQARSGIRLTNFIEEFLESSGVCGRQPRQVVVELKTGFVSYGSSLYTILFCSTLFHGFSAAPS